MFFSKEFLLDLYKKFSSLYSGNDIEAQGGTQFVSELKYFLATDYFNQNEQHKELLDRMLTDFSGKEVAVSIQSVKGDRDIEDHYVDLSQVIHMDLEEEDS